MKNKCSTCAQKLKSLVYRMPQRTMNERMSELQIKLNLQKTDKI